MYLHCHLTPRYIHLLMLYANKPVVLCFLEVFVTFEKASFGTVARFIFTYLHKRLDESLSVLMVYITHFIIPKSEKFLFLHIFYTVKKRFTVNVEDKFKNESENTQ